MIPRWSAAALCIALALSSCSCNPRPCAEGTASCPCRTGSACDEGLVCQADNTCSAPVSSGVHVGDPAARGCELVLTEGAGASVVGVAFSNGLKGAWVREAPKVAVTFVAGGDKAIADGSVVVSLSGGAVTIAKASCVDLRGARIAGNPVELK